MFMLVHDHLGPDMPTSLLEDGKLQLGHWHFVTALFNFVRVILLQISNHP